MAILLAVTAGAQSSGSFTYGSTGNNTTGCVLLSSGRLSGGTSNCSVSAGGGNFTCSTNADCTAILGSNSGATCVGGVCQLPNTGTGACNGSVTAGIKTNSGNGNVFVATVSAVIGLLTDVTVSSKQATPSSSALAGIDFKVNVCPESGQAAPSVTPNYTITFDSRFIQISTNLFSVLTTQCAALTNGCFITFAESTVSAHSFSWIVGSPANGGSACPTVAGPGAALSSGQYGLTAAWGPSSGFGVSGIGEAAACVGPVNFTVQQNKIFSFNTVNSL